MSGCRTKASRNSAWDAAVAATTRAVPRSRIAPRIAVAACTAAALPSDFLSGNTLITKPVSYLCAAAVNEVWWIIQDPERNKGTLKLRIASHIPFNTTARVYSGDLPVQPYGLTNSPCFS